MKDIIAQTDIDVTKINPSLLPSVPLEGLGNLPVTSGIYFAILPTGEILYIGKAVCIKRRWDAHHKFEEIKPYKGARIAWFTYSAQTDEDLAEVERACISHFKPVLNHASGPNGFIKATYYITPEQSVKLERIRRARRMRGEKVDKSELIREAIDKLVE